MPTISIPAAHRSGWNASAGEHHVAAVRAAVEHRARRVDLRPRAQPVVQRREVAHRVEPQAPVVEMLEALAVAGRAAHVRRRDRVAARDEVLRQRREARREPRPPLRLRAAVHGDDDRERPLALGLEQEHRDRLAVEAVEAVQLGLDEGVRVDVARAHGQPRQAASLDVVHVDVARLGRAGERDGEQRAVRREDRLLDDAVRQRHLFAQRERAPRHAPRGASGRPRSRARAACGPPRRARSRDPSATRAPSPMSGRRGRSGRSRTCRAPRSSRRRRPRSRAATPARRTPPRPRAASRASTSPLSAPKR